MLESIFSGYMCRQPLKNPTLVLSVVNNYYSFRPHLSHFLGIQIQFSQPQLGYCLSLFKLCIFPFLNPSYLEYFLNPPLTSQKCAYPILVTLLK